jgi:hypothetical protein
MRLVLAGFGLAAIGYGVYGWLFADGSKPVSQFLFLAAVLIGHDFVVLPLAIGAGALVTRFAPARVRRPALVALVISGAVSLVALPFVLGKGRIPDNPSAFPQHYGRNLLLLLAIVWLVAGAFTVVRFVTTTSRK